MKHLNKLAIAVLMIPALASCNQDKIDQLSSENETLSSRQVELNQELETYLKTFNEIEANLKEIKEREDQINLRAEDNVEYQEGDSKTAIVQDIKAINALMAENKEKMAELQQKLEQSGSEFKKMVNNLNYRIKLKDEEIAQMKSAVDSLSIEKEQLTQNVETLAKRVDTLSNIKNEQMALIEQQKTKIDEQITSLNTAYVAIGSSKELQDENVVVKEGGILGLGSTETLNKNLSEKSFSKIDKSEVRSIPVLAKKVELITTHPEGSYEFEMNEDEKIEKLVILDPSKFWEASKYLVVKVD
jgi:chromosome segregation ATPase